MGSRSRSDSTVPDCLTCGICCVAPYDQEAYADVTAEDCKLLGRSWVFRNVMFPSLFDNLLAAIDSQRLVFGAIKTKWRLQRSGPLKGRSACTCIALRGTLGKKVHCSVYDKRPMVCQKAVVPGDRTCRRVRREHGIK